jgi:nucleoside permease NupC
MLQFQSALGIIALLGIVWLTSESRRAVHWRSVGVALRVHTLQSGVVLN